MGQETTDLDTAQLQEQSLLGPEGGGAWATVAPRLVSRTNAVTCTCVVAEYTRSVGAITGPVTCAVGLCGLMHGLIKPTAAHERCTCVLFLGCQSGCLCKGMGKSF